MIIFPLKNGGKLLLFWYSWKDLQFCNWVPDIYRLIYLTWDVLVDTQTFLSLVQLSSTGQSYDAFKPSPPDEIANLVIEHLPCVSPKFLFGVFKNKHFHSIGKVTKVDPTYNKGKGKGFPTLRQPLLHLFWEKFFWTIGITQHSMRSSSPSIQVPL